MASHRHWRVRSLGGAANYFVVQYIEFQNSAGVDQVGSGTPLAGGVLSGSFALANAFVDNTSNWASDQDHGHPDCWIGYDFGVATEITQIQVRIRGDSNFSGSTPQRWIIEYSDDASSSPTTWETAWEVCEFYDGSYTDNWERSSGFPKFLFQDPVEFPLSSATAIRFWRLECTDSPGKAGGGFYAIGGFGFEDGVGGSITNPSGLIADLMVLPYHESADTEDKIFETTGASASAVDAATSNYGMCMVIPYDIAGGDAGIPIGADLRLLARPSGDGGASSAQQCPTSFTLYGSNGGPWQVVLDVSGEPAWSADEERLYEITTPSDGTEARASTVALSPLLDDSPEGRSTAIFAETMRDDAPEYRTSSVLMQVLRTVRQRKPTNVNYNSVGVDPAGPDISGSLTDPN